MLKIFLSVLLLLLITSCRLPKTNLNELDVERSLDYIQKFRYSALYKESTNSLSGDKLLEKAAQNYNLDVEELKKALLKYRPLESAQLFKIK